MNKRILIAVVLAGLLAAGNICFAAENTSPLTFEEKNKDSQIIFLLQDIDVRVNEDWSCVTKVHKKVKILKEESREMGEIPIFYENGKEKITDIQAYTITPDNKKHSFSKIQDLKLYNGFPMYSDSMVKVITLPEVTIGSILEYECTIFAKELSIKNAFWYTSNLSPPDPTKKVRFSFSIPKKLKVNYKEFGLTKKPKISEDKYRITYVWDVEDVDAPGQGEDYLPYPTPENTKESFEFSSINSWKDISDWYFALVNKNLKVSPQMEKAAQEIAGTKTSLKDKARAILQYVQENFRYVSMSFGNNTLEPHPTDQVFKNKYGDCKDLSLLTMAMLKVVGISSQIGLFNTEYNINDPQYDLPIPTLFNHVILLVNDPQEGDFYLDPLLDGYDINQYPSVYQWAYIFIINDQGGKFSRFPVFDEQRNFTSSHQIITIGEDGSALIEEESLWSLDFSIENRRRINAMNKEEKEKFYEALDNSVASGGEMLERRLEGLDQKYGTIKAFSRISRKDEYPVTDGVMIINIKGYERGFLFSRKTRDNPIFYPYNSLSEEITTYRIPKGFEISYVPPDLSLDNGYMNIKREYKKGQDEIKVIETTRNKRVELPKEEYGKIKEFSDRLPAKTQQRIMIKKVEGK